jgi:hypothetical protein
VTNERETLVFPLTSVSERESTYHFAYNSVSDTYNNNFYFVRYCFLLIKGVYCSTTTTTTTTTTTITVKLYGNNNPLIVMKDIKGNMDVSMHVYYTAKDNNRDPDIIACYYNNCVLQIECYTQNVPHNTFISMMKNSLEPIFVTGDQSFTEAIYLNKLFLYQTFSWKERLINSFKELIKQIGVSERGNEVSERGNEVSEQVIDILISLYSNDTINTKMFKLHYDTIKSIHTKVCKYTIEHNTFIEDLITLLN